MKYYLYLEAEDKDAIRFIIMDIVNHYVGGSIKYPEYRQYCPMEAKYDITLTESNDYVRTTFHLRKNYNDDKRFKLSKNRYVVYANKVLGNKRPQTNEEVLDRFREICINFACYYIYYFEEGLEIAPKDCNTYARWNTLKQPVFTSNIREMAEEIVDRVLFSDRGEK